MTFYLGVVDKLGSSWPHTLTEGNSDKFLNKPSLLSELQQLTCRVSALTEDKDQWSIDGQVIINDFHLDRRRLNVKLVHFFDDIHGH